MTILDKIHAHEQVASSITPPSDLQTCPKCQGHPQCFKAYDCRSRIFLVIVEGTVKKIHSFLSRWECPLCGKKFLYYPDFAIPFKRYVKDSIAKLCKRYLSDDKATYRSVIKEDKTPIVYHEEENASIEYADEEDNKIIRQLEPSTVWRWLGYIGSLVHTPPKALNPIRQSLPESEIFRQMQPFPARKYRSEERKQLLIQAKIFFSTQGELTQISAFPKFAIKGFRF